MSDRVEMHWRAIEDALARIAPTCAATLAPPATEEEIELLQQSLGLALPEDLRASLRRHNGQNDPGRRFDFCGAGTLLSTAGIADSWRMLADIDEELAESTSSRVQVQWWKRTLVPFTDADGYMLCVDMDLELPRVGEVVWFVHDGEIERGVAASYGDWLADVALRIQNGGLRLNKFGYPELNPRF